MRNVLTLIVGLAVVLAAGWVVLQILLEEDVGVAVMALLGVCFAVEMLEEWAGKPPNHPYGPGER